MLLSSTVTLVAIFALPALIYGGQVPVVDGVTGGVPYGAHDYTNPAGVTSTLPLLTPGKLRVVENSGVCGEVI
jgi:hypothetical protein